MSRKYVFVDWNDIEAGYGVDLEGYVPHNGSPYGVKIVGHQPYIDPNPIIFADTPWETSRAGVFASFVKIDGKYHAWYDAIGPRIKLAYATSDDGIHWVKPHLGIVEFNGSRENNIVVNNDVPNQVDEGWAVIYQPEAPESERFKIVFTRVFYEDGNQHDVWQMGAVSPDGINWKETGKLFKGGDTQSSLVYDKKRKKYVVMTKAQDGENIARRTLICAESDDFKTFRTPYYVLHGDVNDDPDTDYYTPSYHLWKGAENAHVLFPTRFHRTEDFTEIQIAVSRDLHTWSKPNNGKVIIGPNQTDRLSNYADLGMTEDGNGNWVHYFGSTTAGHNGSRAPLQKPNVQGIYRFVFREDGYTSLKAESHGGFTTLGIDLGKGLKINADIQFYGYIKIAVTDWKTNEPIEGYGFEECKLEKLDNNSYAVTWAKPVCELPKNRNVRLKFEMFKADLYSYTVETEENASSDAPVPYVVAL